MSSRIDRRELIRKRHGGETALQLRAAARTVGIPRVRRGVTSTRTGKLLVVLHVTLLIEKTYGTSEGKPKV